MVLVDGVSFLLVEIDRSSEDSYIIHYSLCIKVMVHYIDTYTTSISSTRFGVPSNPSGITYVKFQNSKSLYHRQHNEKPGRA